MMMLVRGAELFWTCSSFGACFSGDITLLGRDVFLEPQSCVKAGHVLLGRGSAVVNRF